MAVPPRLPGTLKELPRANARLCLRVRRFLQEIAPEVLSPAVPVLIAFSGGADSTALALILHCLGLPVRLGHLDHGLRPESADEARAALDFARRLGVPCLTEKEDVAALARRCGNGLEEAGRLARYRFLERARVSSGSEWIATGHHLDDLCEDMLMRLIRGTGWPGLGGMAAADADRRLLRPLLSTRRDELTAFLASLGLAWIDDPSNRDARFTRNRVRNSLLPRIREENPDFAGSVGALWRLARIDETFWSEAVAPALARVRRLPLPEGTALHLPRDAFVHLPQAARLRVYMGLIRLGRERTGRGQARAKTLFQLDKACLAGRSVRRFQLPGALLLVAGPDGLHLYGAGPFPSGDEICFDSKSV